jgi:two-component system response regulator HydG
MEKPDIASTSATGAIKLLIVDDDASVRQVCEALLNAMGVDTFSAASAREALSLLERRPVDVVLTDLRMPNMDGLEFTSALRAAHPDVYVILMSGAGSIQTAVEAIKLGAYDFITKPFRSNQLRQILHRIDDERALNLDAWQLRQQAEQLGAVALLLDRSPELRQIHKFILRAANSSNPVLILGAAGTGKELLARSVHLATARCNLPFVPVDCWSLTPKLLEGELFGYARGAFPGAETDKKGILANPECGAIFFHEIGDLALDLQAKLARAIEQKAVRPYGAVRSIPLTARIMASSSYDLAQSVAKGKFRQDLYYLLNVFSVRLPSLIDRRENIPLLVQYFLRRVSDGTGPEKTISKEVLHAFASHDWPGNVRELENVLERACAMGNGPSITLSDLPINVTGKLPALKNERECRNQPLAEIERTSVLQAIEDSGGDKQKAARLLGISRTTLYRKLNEYRR